jgi:hypothetical protein
MRWLKGIAICSIVWMFSGAHPYYLSVADLKYNAAEKVMEGSVKVFVHDLERTLNQLGQGKVDLIHVKDRAATSRMLSTYLADHFQMKVNGKPLHMELLGFEQEAEHLWMHVKFTGSPAPKSVEITDRILYDHLKEQMNIVHLQVGETSRSYKVTNPDAMIRFSF